MLTHVTHMWTFFLCISFKSPPQKIKMTETKQKEIDDALMQLLVGKV